ncbi:MAG TPA: anti-sigma factor [Actinomycetota bacterium]|nr:anti-sigma factor [Actinomycetota bacterium]
MATDHERFEELLAGHALHALAGQDLIDAHRLLAEHVPSCASCRRTLAEMQALTGELALAAEAATPSRLLLPRIRRRIEELPRDRRISRRAALVSAAAGIAALAAMGALSLSLGNRASVAETQRGTAMEMLSVMRSPGATPVGLHPQSGTPDQTGFVEVSAPEIRRLYLASDACPEPAPGHAYQLWLGSGGSFVPIGGMFRPRNGMVLLELVVDVSRHDEILITEELAGTRPSHPRTEGGRSWHAML